MAQQDATTALVYDASRASAGAREFEQASEKIKSANQNVVQTTERVQQVFGNQERALDRLRRQIDPAYQAQQKLAQGQELLDRALQRGAITSDEHAKRLEQLRQRYDATFRAQGAMEQASKAQAAALDASTSRTKLTAHEITNLTYQLQDAAVQLAGGQNPFLILMQQGPQATAAVGGVGRALSLLASPIGLVIAAGLGLAATFAVMEKHAAALREVQTAVTLMGEAIGRSADELEALAVRAADAGKISVSAAREQEAAYIRAGKLGAESMERLIGLSRDYAVATKQDIAKAADDLAQLFADPVAGAEKLTAAYGLLSGKELERIRVLKATGQEEQARLLLADSLATRTRGLGDQVGTLASAWERVSRAAANAFNAIGNATAPETNAQAIARLEAKRRQLLAARGLDDARLAAETGGVSLPPDSVPVDGRYAAPGMATASGELATVDASLAQRYAQRGREREMAARVADWQGQVTSSVAADTVARSVRPMATEITALTESITKLETGLKNPGLMAFADDAGKALEGLKNKRADYEAAAAQGLDIETYKRQRLTAVEQKYAGLVGPAYAAQKAAEVERINLLGTATTAEERKLAVGAAVTQVTAGQAQAVAQLTAALSVNARESLAVADAYLKSAAAGAEAEARRQAATEALSMNIDVKARTQQLLQERAAQQAATSAQALPQMQADVAGRQAVAEATLAGVEAQQKAELAEKVRQATVAESILLEKAQGGTADALRRIIEAKTQAVIADDAAQRKARAGAILQGQEEQIAQLGKERELLFATAEQRAVGLARLQAEQQLRRDGLALQSTEAQRILANAEALAKAGVEMDRLNELGQTFDRAFDRVGDALTEAFTQGSGAAVSFRSVVSGVLSSIATDMLKLYALTPFKNWLMGGVSSLFGLVGGNSAGMPAPTTDYGIAMRINAGTFHSGGVIGQPAPANRSVSPAVFRGAPRYHTGGLAGLAPDEVPAILRAREEVITEDDPRHRFNLGAGGGSGSVTFGDINIEVNASGGTQEQNADLADQIGRAVGEQLDARIVTVLRQQMRPMGLLNGGSR